MVEDGQAAIDALQYERYDLILLDIKMPVVSGLDAARALRAAGFIRPLLGIGDHPVAYVHLHTLHILRAKLGARRLLNRRKAVAAPSV